MAEIRERRDVWKLKQSDDEWDPILLWYSKAVAEMQKRPITEPLSWRYQAAIHDYRRDRDPFAQPNEDMPSDSDQKQFWKQCQHFSWFFLPWHRMYLAYFEQIVADTIVRMDGPPGWALPYWNYSDPKNPDARKLPPAFIAKKRPDGAANALRVENRLYGNDGSVIADDDDVDISCLNEPSYTAAETGGNPGFGGPKTRFNHNSGTVGLLEATPHGNMHMVVNGWMGSFLTAGLDPIFWLHHSNIDRLWVVWRKRNAQNLNPVEALWLKGVSFDFHDASGKSVTQTAEKVVDTTVAPLSYKYEDESDPLTVANAMFAFRGVPVAREVIPEMVGATEGPVNLVGQPATARLSVKPPTGPARGAALTAAVPRIYLNVENITGPRQTGGYLVYLNLPEGADPSDYRDHLAGSIPLFGVEEASSSDESHSGSGLHYRLEVGEVIRSLEAKGNWDSENLRITFIPKRRRAGAETAFRAEAQEPVQIGRVSLYFA